ncbi:MAG TPA: ATP-binding protein [Gaiellaceae bacterium]|nr:ATP-binding protein [Gaiellaceae bacterium]
MSPFRGVGARLSAALLLVLVGAFAIAYGIVVPSFERALVNSKLAGLERNAHVVAAGLRTAPTQQWQEVADEANADFSARVVIFTDTGPLLSFADSNPGRASDVAADPVALHAMKSGKPEHGTVTRRGQRFAEAAVPSVQAGAIVLLSGSLHDTLATVQLAQRRLLIAAAIAFGFALLLGYGGAYLFARRLRRLERAADRIAGGSFDQPVVDPGADEIGQLARAFERMRLRLAQLDRARSEFIANASHELRTPLFSLGGFLELLTEEEMDDATREEFLAQMRRQVDRLAKLATDLLDLSRLDAGRMSVEREPVALGSVAASVAAEFTPRARRQQRALALEGDAEAVALGDEQRIAQIARILVDNALLHTPPGTMVRVRTRRVGGTAVLAVEDDGPGIPGPEAAQVFERFHRLSGAVAAGSGLGLAIARELAELMGGRLELESQPGRTVFTLVLSVAVVRDQEPVPV